ncbi:Protein CBG01708 [Caenorhabditis briggsae]|uniref:Protein CBG01708 n=1 Tax=Caenorhabditis briggsae TaxID=6238 RepID=A8WR12_CAEBR|nr:Protein CBG01708 [Caenorhabditis briggsae]CAP22920.2 Protein CBG01708 [Caenorhabditis briggsae]
MEIEDTSRKQRYLLKRWMKVMMNNGFRPRKPYPIFRNKSIIRSSSSGSYPYPRTHTTLMVIPSNRPPPPPQPVKMFTGVRRRPPLNRACPPIPESKSNESIMSHASRVSEWTFYIASTPTPTM